MAGQQSDDCGVAGTDCGPNRYETEVDGSAVVVWDSNDESDDNSSIPLMVSRCEDESSIDSEEADSDFFPEEEADGDSSPSSPDSYGGRCCFLSDKMDGGGPTLHRTIISCTM